MVPSPIVCSMSLFALLFLLATANKSTGTEVCPTASCLPDGPKIRFPFRIAEVQGEQCGYEGFEVSCDNRSRTILHLLGAGDFVVVTIDYPDQFILVKDPDGCLPKRLLENAFMSSYSPFSNPEYENFTFAKCSPGYSTAIEPESGITRIGCLGLGRRMVVAAVADDDLAKLWMSRYRCRTWSALIPWWRQRPMSISESIWLRWDQPDCKSCEAANGSCRLENSKSGSKLVCMSKHGISTAAQFAIASLFILPWLTCIFGFLWFLKFRLFVHRGLDLIGSNVDPGSARSNHDGEAVELAQRDAIGVMGIDSPTIESYLKTRIDDLGQLPRPNDDVCTICLSRYERNEMIRTIPECEHYFHAYCIYQWLRKNASCPLCRHYKGNPNAVITSN